jgi:hypothetical protein
MTYLLSPHFSVEEMIKSDTAAAQGIVNAPNFDVLVQMVLLANNTLEGIRALCGGNPLIISSGFRCGDLNEAVGGAENSAHLLGCAADFIVPNFGSVADIIAAIEPNLEELQIDQLINEYGSWVHVGRAAFGQTPRYQSFGVT